MGKWRWEEGAWESGGTEGSVEKWRYNGGGEDYGTVETTGCPSASVATLAKEPSETPWANCRAWAINSKRNSQRHSALRDKLGGTTKVQVLRSGLEAESREFQRGRGERGARELTMSNWQLARTA